MENRNKLLDLRENRFSNPLTQKEMANKLELSTSQQYQKYEYDPESLSKKAIEKASSFFKVSPQYFLDNSYGNIVCSAPFFKDFNSKKNRISYYDFDEKASNIVVSKDISITNFFVIYIESKALLENRPLELTRYYRGQKRESLQSPRCISFSNCAKFEEIDNKNPNLQLLLMKANTDELKTQNNPYFYLVEDKDDKKRYLAYIKKKSRFFEIIYVFDFDENKVLNLCPYPSNEISNISRGIRRMSLNLSRIDLSYIDVIGKVIYFYDPKDVFPFFAEDISIVDKSFNPNLTNKLKKKTQVKCKR